MDAPTRALLAIILIASLSSAQSHATLQGYVRDGNSGESIPEVKVDVYLSQDHGKTVASTSTDEKGFYILTVPPGEYYDVYLRTGEVNPNQRTSQAVQANGVYTLNFNIVAESAYSSSVVEKYGVSAIVILAFILFAIILYDRLASRKPTKQDTASLRKQKDEIQGMLDLARYKYHHREIDEESFRAITKDQQEKLIELEARLGKQDGKA